MMRVLSRLSVLVWAVLIAGCATPQREVDYTAFRASKPASILVLPPLNSSVDPEAVAAVLAQATLPLAESGYYVVPVAVMAETFRQNGVSEAGDIHNLPATKLREIFGADAVLYLTVEEYGSSYQVLSSKVTVSLSATLVDLRTGAQLWNGAQTAQKESGSGGGGLLGALVNAVVSQIANTLSDASYDVAGQASQHLLRAGTPGGILYGPRSPNYLTQ